MYIRAAHAEADLRALRSLVRDNPLGLFTTAISSPSFPFLQSSHIPFVLDVEDEGSETELGRLRGHLARQNPQSKAIIEEINSPKSVSSSTNVLEHDVLIIFTSPAHHYVTPKFYTETKPATGKVVPTWNYAAVQVYGRAKVFIDPKSAETSNFLKQQISELTHRSETTIMGYNCQDDKPQPWKVTDAPENFVELLKKAIIGVEIDVQKMEGKFKMSQEMGDGDTDGVIQGFRNLGTDTGRQIADTVLQRREIKARSK
ncbi:transcriptional regulator PAI 2-type [Ilyonectria destructans]|nr:transcriptional regulator PAI 2-type [Ilyonectria sp. MPI-CAGE-AT-0026]KAH6974694.1 transcriptional regulator PAI 2-type [Ilyonectria destructans]